MSKQFKKQLVNILVLVILIALTLLALFLSNRELNFASIFEFLAQCNPWWIVAALAASALFIVFEGLSLHFLLRGLGEKPKLFSSMIYSSADVYYSAITPSATGGQPASAFYMVKDGVRAGKASFALVYNLVGYTTAILVLGFAALILRPSFYGSLDDVFTRVLIIAGFVLQGLLLGFFVACMFCGGAVKKVGNWLIGLLNKLRIVKKPEKWRTKLADEVEKYRECRGMLRSKPMMSFANFVLNLAQRTSHVLVSCFVCLAAAPHANFIDLFALECLVLVGYNSIPLPGGVGAFEYLYLNIYCIIFGNAFILAAMMVTRVISYYLRMLAAGAFTLGYHIHLVRKHGKETVNGENTNETESGGHP